MKIVIAIIIFSIIILFHELGHFLVAKKCGIRVNEFCLGLGPTLFGITKGETKYSIHLLPFGGACMMEGEDGDSTDDRAFTNKPVWARIAVVAAGPLFNFIMAFVFSVILIACIGYDKPVISGVMDGYPAQEAGMQEGDTIVKMNHKNIHFCREINLYLYFHAGETVDVTYERDGKETQVTLTPVYDEESGGYYVGFYENNARTRANVGDSLKYGVYYTKYWVDLTFESVRMLFTGKVGVQDMSGPVGIVKTIGDTYEESKTDGMFYVFINMLNISILLSA